MCEGEGEREGECEGWREHKCEAECYRLSVVLITRAKQTGVFRYWGLGGRHGGCACAGVRVCVCVRVLAVKAKTNASARGRGRIRGRGRARVRLTVRACEGERASVPYFELNHMHVHILPDDCLNIFHFFALEWIQALPQSVR